ncbi:hypothetical protein [uncultured Bacteroides sp.]|uniref:hypothetical protein n=1 Tax=uncultured Bacteroides sp. TaxID=162156 RepID=UPI002AAAE885|nr:hypothetical protein [uncultured Bacteroides sp.]
MSEDVIKYAIEQGIKLGIAAYRNEEKQKRANPRILIVKSEAEKMVGGRMVLKALEKRGFIFPYQFGIEDMIDEDGNLLKKIQGRVYYRLCEIEKALENGNLLSSIRVMRKQIQ